MSEFKVIFRGVRGSHPVASKNSVRYGGNTACVEVRVGGHLIILDAGTGIINLGDDLLKKHIVSGTDRTNRKPINAVILFSHAHNDHIQGLQFFKPSYISTSNIYLYGARCLGEDFYKVLTQSMYAPYSPIDLEEMSADIKVNNLKETESIILYPDKAEPEIKRLSTGKDNLPKDTVLIEGLKSFAHPKDGVMVFKISWNEHSIVYATDKESYVGGDSKLISFARGADLLIHDAQYTAEDYSSLISPKQGYGHSTPEMAIETARLANVKKLVLFHHDPSYSDEQLDMIEENSKKQFKNTVTAYESLEIDLIPTKVLA